MTREQAKELLPIIQAWTEGQTIEYLDNEGRWAKGDDLSFCSELKRYRIKPEPKYRPFKTKEECWNEMLKHQPFGWVRGKHPELLYQIISVSDFDVTLSIYEKSSFPASLIQFEFADGTPFGIKEE